MSPTVPLELSWLVAPPRRALRARRLAAAAGVAADLDGLTRGEGARRAR
jgi:hypothetical protein